MMGSINYQADDLAVVRAKLEHIATYGKIEAETDDRLLLSECLEEIGEIEYQPMSNNKLQGNNG